jgi:hypothetical protein
VFNLVLSRIDHVWIPAPPTRADRLEQYGLKSSGVTQRRAAHDATGRAMTWLDKLWLNDDE